MAKQGMKRPERTKLNNEGKQQKKNPKQPGEPVPELQGKAKLSNEKAKPIITNRKG